MADDQHNSLEDLRVAGFDPLVTPVDVERDAPIDAVAAATVAQGRQELREALTGADPRLVVISGPCSVHEPQSAIEYANRLAALRKRVSDQIILVMRVYFEKPRTTVGWKGFIYDPRLDGSHDMNRGIRHARNILLDINRLGLPCATEFLDPIVPQYIADQIAWVAIGARTTESQTHRQMASGLSMPVGFKNATDGSLQVALDAMASAAHPHAFLGIDHNGQSSIVRTLGNRDTHLVLRGGRDQPNYSKAHLAYAKALLTDATDNPRAVIVDCSHANTDKDYTRQPTVFREVVDQVLGGESSILGLMLESHLVEGKQPLGADLVYGQSVTDACIGWERTEELILQTHALLGESR